MMRCCDCEFRKECRDAENVLTAFVRCDMRDRFLKEKKEKEMTNADHIRSTCCKYCFDASVDNEIEGYDFSYHSIGKAENGFRFLFRNGGSKPIAILFEKWNVNQWNLIGIYKPKYCPECGRPLKEDE